MSAWVMVYGDPAQKGDIIGTWKNFAVAVFTLWIVNRSPVKDPKEIELDKQRADNTGKALDNIGAAINSTPSPLTEHATDSSVDVSLKPGESATIEAKP